ncbi:MAG TPA: DciA family protein [Paucimonas sp.]|nr:DciA family protein [Paucimonas sp.]
MAKSTNFIPHPPRARSVPTATGAVDFLRSHDKMSVILPTLKRLAAIRKDCSALLPALFETCSVLHLAEGQLTLAAPNAALATRLKQQLPKLQDGLLQRGWQVNAIRIKVQVSQPAEKPPTFRQRSLSKQALASFSSLADALEDTPRNQALKMAIAAMVKARQAGS